MDASFISFKQFHGGGNVLKKMIRLNLEYFDDISSTKPQLQKAKSIYSCYELLYIKAFDFLFKLKQLYLLLVKYDVTNNETNTFIQKNKTTMKKVLITYALNPEIAKELDGKVEYVIPEKSDFKRNEVMEMIADFDVIVPNFSFYTDKEMMDKGVKLELISNFAVGFNNIDVAYAKQKGITVTNIPNSVTEPTAEFAFALLLAAGRRIGYYDRKIRIPQGLSWGLYDEPGLPIYGKSLGIIGMGRIGQALARRAVASGMTIMYHNRNRLDKSIENKYNARYVSLETLLRESDYVSLNAPSTEKTIRMIGKKELEMMKPTAVFINTARGNMVDEEALANALKEKQIWAAGLDVFENEPKVSPLLLELDNVVLAPHAATKTLEARDEMGLEMIRNILGFYFDTYPISKVV